MPIGRRAVNVVRYVLEDLLPPALRDSVLFLPVMYLVFGREAKRFISFRDEVRTMSEADYAACYAAMKPLMGGTDLNRACIARIIAEVKGDNVLDAGCGRGWLATEIARGYPDKNVVGADIDPPAVADAPSNLSFVEGWMGCLPFADGAFDTVVCTHTLEHILDIDEAVADLRRIARQRLILVVPREREAKYALNLHLHFFPYTHSFLNRIRPPEGRFVCDVLHGDIYYREDLGRGRREHEQ